MALKSTEQKRKYLQDVANRTAELLDAEYSFKSAWIILNPKVKWSIYIRRMVQQFGLKEKTELT